MTIAGQQLLDKLMDYYEFRGCQYPWVVLAEFFPRIQDDEDYNNMERNEEIEVIKNFLDFIKEDN